MDIDALTVIEGYRARLTVATEQAIVAEARLTTLAREVADLRAQVEALPVADAEPESSSAV